MPAPSVAGMTPDEQHHVVLRVLDEVRLADVIRLTNRYRGSRIEQGHEGRRRILERHKPYVHQSRPGPRCLACTHPTEHGELAPWPCPTYTDAAAGLAADLPPLAPAWTEHT